MNVQQVTSACTRNYLEISIKLHTAVSTKWHQVNLLLDLTYNNLVSKANFVHNFFLVYLFLVHLSIATCFGRLRAHHQEKQLCLSDIWHLQCLVCNLHTRQSSTQNNKYQVSHKHSCFPRWWAHSHPKHVVIDKYTKNKYTKKKIVHQVRFTYKIIQGCTV